MNCAIAAEGSEQQAMTRVVADREEEIMDALGLGLQRGCMRLPSPRSTVSVQLRFSRTHRNSWISAGELLVTPTANRTSNEIRRAS